MKRLCSWIIPFTMFVCPREHSNNLTFKYKIEIRLHEIITKLNNWARTLKEMWSCIRNIFPKLWFDLIWSKMHYTCDSDSYETGNQWIVSCRVYVDRVSPYIDNETCVEYIRPGLWSVAKSAISVRRSNMKELFHFFLCLSFQIFCSFSFFFSRFPRLVTVFWQIVRCQGGTLPSLPPPNWLRYWHWYALPTLFSHDLGQENINHYHTLGTL